MKNFIHLVCEWENSHIINTSILSKFSEIPTKIPTEFFMEIYNLILKFSQNHPKGKEQSEEICPTRYQHFSNARVFDKYECRSQNKVQKFTNKQKSDMWQMCHCKSERNG